MDGLPLKSCYVISERKSAKITKRYQREYTFLIERFRAENPSNTQQGTTDMWEMVN
jgi:hypothetical protein